MEFIDEIISNQNIDISKYLDRMGYNASNNEVLFFDIETTGLNVKKTSLYLIGYVYYKDDNWHYAQLFGTSPKEEALLLMKFNKICKEYKYIVHFNGDHFDIPYISQKCIDYNLGCELLKLQSVDLYLLVKDYKLHLGLANCRQKTIESFLALTREDKYNGGELIYQYFDFIKTKDEKLHYNLLLHNAEDLKGMLELLKIIDYIKLIDILTNFEFKIEIITPEDKSKFNFIISFIDKSVICSLHYDTYWLNNYSLNIDKKAGTIRFNTELEFNTMKHFFKDITNYYYIPEIDSVVHKSIASSMPSSKKEKAKVANCYIKKEGCFLPAFGLTNDIDYFKTDSKSLAYFFLIVDIKTGNTLDINKLSSFLTNSIKNIAIR